ncbi:MAG TPA: hypothetical protein VN420_03600 [Candidatus Fimivivens sp.]|nr:hypothetical protein [Candidatus Fimivivens sp.]
MEYKKNRHGHYVVPIVGKALTGAQECILLPRLWELDDGVATVLTYREKGKERNGYDEFHILEEGRRYRVALISAIDGIRFNVCDDEAQLRCFGYERPRAGIMPRLAELLSRRMMAEMGISSIIGLHQPIRNPNHHYENNLLRLNGEVTLLSEAYGRLEAYADDFPGEAMLYHYQAEWIEGREYHVAVIDPVEE